MCNRAVSNILAKWEAEEPYQYGAPLLALAGESGTSFVVSDLHLGAGLATDGTSDGLENFFADAAFTRFLDWANRRTSSGKATLIINGDFVDFLRITTLPVSEDDFARWRKILTELSISKTIDELKQSITDRERKYGLKTDDYKSVFKLSVVAKGHQPAFDTLAVWVGQGHRLIIIKGNHDLEWYWRAVRDRLRVILAQNIVRLQAAPDMTTALTSHVLPNTIFADHGVVLDGDMYLEHGHQYDKYSHVLGPAVLPGGTELNIPFGSFLNRYLLNMVELHYPFVDNVRPAQNLLPLLIRERFFLALKLLFYHIPFLILIIPKRYYRYMLARVLPLAAVLAAPIGLLLWNLKGPLAAILRGGSTSSIAQGLAGQLVLPVASYFLGRLIAYLQLLEPSTLNPFARDFFRGSPQYRMATFGHTHNPDQFTDGNHHYCNTGTWIPVVETSTADLRTDLTYTFLEIGRDAQGLPLPPFLQRWDDDGGRAELLRVIRAD